MCHAHLSVGVFLSTYRCPRTFLLNKKEMLISQHLFLNNAGDRNRTGTGGKSRRILSPVRLPVPPRRHPKYRLDHWLVEWTEVDSNHRSKMQQIYSLSPLASRESVHVGISSSQECILAHLLTKCKYFFKKLYCNMIHHYTIFSYYNFLIFT